MRMYYSLGLPHLRLFAFICGWNEKINRGWTQMHADTLRVGTFGLLVFVVGIITSLKLLRVPLLYLITIIDGGELNE